MENFMNLWKIGNITAKSIAGGALFDIGRTLPWSNSPLVELSLSRNFDRPKL